MQKNSYNILHKTGVRVSMRVFTFLKFSFLSIFSILTFINQSYFVDGTLQNQCFPRQKQAMSQSRVPTCHISFINCWCCGCCCCCVGIISYTNSFSAVVHFTPELPITMSTKVVYFKLVFFTEQSKFGFSSDILSVAEPTLYKGALKWSAY